MSTVSAPPAVSPTATPADSTGTLLNNWFRATARPLPWREPGTSAWAVLLSEIMSQQTPVARVEPLWRQWVDRWPTPADLADAPTDDILRAWANLGYPRRALRLQECARTIVERHGGEVPQDVADLLALPGIGGYTARAVAAFAFGSVVPVVDTNVRRVHRRLVRGDFLQGPAKARDLADVADLLPWVDADPDLDRRGYTNPLHDRSRRSEARGMCSSLMELGAVVCTARSPRCEDCPVASRCRWLALGRPEPSDAAAAEAKRRVQKFEGTDRQVRGRIMAVLRRDGSAPDFPDAGPDAAQRERALASLLADGLVVKDDGPDGGYRLPR
ncbi:HhH-GPD family protein [Corynebacterium terpenotabidum]|uniref:Adenine DNA glycosylase n=1 Tax=Corynebacterium terpenotabidum Y-11 TaxID=1200352 RepID=S4XAB2_9CORY|nr:A/G-specific adenine glycosylase [Corynebacterium terpenotabidum]AGP30072.1 A/G-specific adenine glycosylase [Corynebacterium terpenotabidum Y-11]